MNHEIPQFKPTPIALARDWLQRENTPIMTWGGAHSKTIGDFFDTLKDNVAWLHRNGNGLEYHMHVSVVTLRTFVNDRWHELREVKHARNGGPAKRRPFNGSLAEKIDQGEPIRRPILTARRGLDEELGGSQPLFKDPRCYTLVYKFGEYVVPDTSDFYPGLKDHYHRDHWLAVIQQNLYLERYVEVRKGRTIVFEWVPLPEGCDCEEIEQTPGSIIFDPGDPLF